MGRPKKDPAGSEPGTEPARKPGPAPKYVVLRLSDGKDSWIPIAANFDSVDAARASINEIGTYWVVPEQVEGKTLLTASKVETISLS